MKLYKPYSYNMALTWYFKQYWGIAMGKKKKMTL